MDKEVEKLIQQQFASLPASIQDVITNSNWEESLRAIVQKYNLHVDQGASIEDQTLLTMLGFATPDEYVGNLVEHANIPRSKALAVATDVEKQIFQKIRDRLVGESEEEEQPVPQNKPYKDEESPNESNEPEEVISRDEILEGIEHPEPIPVSSRPKPAQEVSKEETPKPEGVPLKETPNKEPSHEMAIPENLPVGNIQDVPKHGHDHTKDISMDFSTSVPTPATAPEPAPAPSPETAPKSVSQLQPEPAPESLPKFDPEPVAPTPKSTDQTEATEAPVPNVASAPTPKPNFMEEKLSQVTVSNSQNSVQSDETQPIPSLKQPDPYREPIE